MLEDRRTRPPNRRLDSWKEIAAYFGRDERTVKRWEKERGLPVCRLPGTRGGVYALTDDLARWMDGRNRKKEESVNGVRTAEQATVEEAPQEPGVVQASVQAAEAQETTSLGAVAEAARGTNEHTWLIRAAVLLLVASAAASLVMLTRKRVSASRATGSDLKASKAYQPSAKAQELYLEGRYYWNKRTPADLTKALDYFQRAVTADPNYAQAYVGIADAYNLLREYSEVPESEAYPRAIAAARKAIELDESLADAHNSLAFGTFYWQFDSQGAEREFQRALTLNPNCSLAHHWYATFLMTIGRNREALEQIEIAQQLDSSSRAILADKALILYHGGRVEEAISLLKQLSETEPSFLSPHRYLAEIYFEIQRYPEYLAQATQAAMLSKDEIELAILEDGAKAFRSGGSQMMLESILLDQKKYYAEGRISAYRLAQTYSLLGRQHEAIAYLRIAHDRRDAALSGLLIDFPLMKLHDDPSYQELLSQLGLPPLQGS